MKARAVRRTAARAHEGREQAGLIEGRRPGRGRGGGGAFEIDAQTGVVEANETLDLDLPTSPDYETVAGFRLFEVRHIPRVGETVNYGRLRFTVLEMDGPKIERVRVGAYDRFGRVCYT